MGRDDVNACLVVVAVGLVALVAVAIVLGF